MLWWHRCHHRQQHHHGLLAGATAGDFLGISMVDLMGVLEGAFVVLSVGDFGSGNVGDV